MLLWLMNLDFAGGGATSTATGELVALSVWIARSLTADADLQQSLAVDADVQRSVAADEER